MVADQIHSGRLGLVRRIGRRALRAAVDLGLHTSRRPQQSLILMYHGIDEREDRRFNNRFFSARSFARHLDYLARHYRLEPLQRLFADDVRDDRPAVAITFDDGYAATFRCAVPVLESRGVPATFFVTALNRGGEPILWADLVEICSRSLEPDLKFQGQSFRRAADGVFHDLKAFCRRQPDPGYRVKAALREQLTAALPWRFDERPDLADAWRLMSDAEIRQLAQSPLFEVGSHGYWHNCLATLPHGAAVQELADSKTYLEELCQREIVSLGYPDGSYTRDLVDAAATIGYTRQLAVDYLFPLDDCADPRLRDRLGLYPPCSARRVDYQIRERR